MKKIIIIGSGFSSMSAACYLAKSGYDVTIVEKNSSAGGRASRLQSDGFTFDLGPTWYWMPDIFEKFFADFDKTPSSYYSLKRLDPSYRIVNNAGEFNVSANFDELIKSFESIEKGAGDKLKKFISICQTTYEIATGEMMYKPGISPLELVSFDTITNINLFFYTVRDFVQKNFTNSILRSMLEFPVLFLGAKPSDTPAFYCFMNYADIILGTWYPMHGFYSVAEGVATLAKQLGVNFIFNTPVKKIVISGGTAAGIETEDEFLSADIVISGADYNHTESLLKRESRNYSDNYWEQKTFAPSALMFFIGLDKKLQNAVHHTLFFDADFDAHAKQIYDKPQWPDDPLFYVSIPSVTDNTVAPEGNENITILIPLSTGLDDSELMREALFGKIIVRLENHYKENIRDHIKFKKSYCVNDFVNDYNSYKGNAYGLANTLSQTAFLRPSIRSKKVSNLYYTGQLTVPGPGVPPALVSGRIVAMQVLKSEKTFA